MRAIFRAFCDDLVTAGRFLLFLAVIGLLIGGFLRVISEVMRGELGLAFALVAMAWVVWLIGWAGLKLVGLRKARRQ